MPPCVTFKEKNICVFAFFFILYLYIIYSPFKEALW